jgi:hypothetical protein
MRVLFDAPAGVARNAGSDTALRIEPTSEVEQYRVDILLTAAESLRLRSSPQLVIECDGSNFHDSIVK